MAKNQTLGKSLKCRNRLKNEPKAYLAWLDWAENKSKTHKQLKCELCGYFHIWVAKL